MNDALGARLAERRVSAALPYVRGRLLDCGCGSNQLVRRYGNGVGVDVHPWPGADVVVKDCSSLQWESGTYDTVTFLACLNHITNREAVLEECKRLLRPRGRVVVTMLTPLVSRIWHWIRLPWDADQRERGMKPGEVYGFTPAEVARLFQPRGFQLRSTRRFMLGLNRVYVFELADCASTGEAPASTASRELTASR